MGNEWIVGAADQICHFEQSRNLFGAKKLTDVTVNKVYYA